MRLAGELDAHAAKMSGIGANGPPGGVHPLSTLNRLRENTMKQIRRPRIVVHRWQSSGVQKNPRMRSAVLRIPALFAALTWPLALEAATITISCSSLGIKSQLCKSGAEDWARSTNNEVRLAPTPSNAEERFALYLTLLAAKSRDIDVFQIDVTWPGALSNHFVDLKTTLRPEELAEHLPALIRNNTVDGRLVAAPFFVDAGLLFYRKDLLEKHGRRVPETWRDLEQSAEAILADARRNGQPDLQGFVWQGKAYEGLACNALEWVASYGGRFVGDDGAIGAGSPMTVAAVEMARRWIGVISPRGVLGYAEEEARGAFQSGKAIFMRNWPYAWALANSDGSLVKGKVGVARLPRGEGAEAQAAATLGGQQLAVSRFSAHPVEAVDLVRHLTSAEEQKRRALEGSFNPTRPRLYDDPDLLKANPFFADFLRVLDSAVARPSAVAGRRYNRVSYEIVQAVHDALTGRGSVSDNMTALQSALERQKRDGDWK